MPGMARLREHLRMSRGACTLFRFVVGVGLLGLAQMTSAECPAGQRACPAATAAGTAAATAATVCIQASEQFCPVFCDWKTETHCPVSVFGRFDCSCVYLFDSSSHDYSCRPPMYPLLPTLLILRRANGITRRTRRPRPTHASQFRKGAHATPRLN